MSAGGFGVDYDDVVVPPPGEPYAPLGANVRTLADVQPEPIDWCWDCRLAAGKLVVVDGDPSLGKSTITVDWAARISTGTPWPDGSPCQVGDVLILSAEDGLADTLRPRLDASGGDPSRVHALTGVTVLDKENRPVQRPITLDDVGVIAGAVKRHSVTLVVVDVLMAYLPSSADAHRDQDVRSVLSRIAQMAEDTGCCVLLLRHLNKAAGGNPLYRGGGSIGIVGAARAAYVVAVDPDDETRRVLACTKNNLAPMPPSLAFRLVSADNGMARVEWLGESTATAATVLSMPTAGAERTERDEAVDWLVNYLEGAGGEAKAGQVLRAAAVDGILKTTLHRARTKAGVTSSKSGLNDGWVWQLPAGRFHEGSEGFNPQDWEPSEPSVDSSPPTLDLTGRPGRCPACQLHVETQGHAATCTEGER